jgi:hypothetical protein
VVWLVPTKWSPDLPPPADVPLLKDHARYRLVAVLCLQAGTLVAYWFPGPGQQVLLFDGQTTTTVDFQGVDAQKHTDTVRGAAMTLWSRA